MRASTSASVALVAALILATAQPGAAQGNDVPLYINYGADARTSEGDNDYQQAIYLSVPATTKRRLFVRIFDPDTGGRFDQPGFKGETITEFSVFGGPGADATAFAGIERLSRQEASNGRLLAKQAFGASPQHDGKWVTIATLEPANGERVGDRILFRLLVNAIRGDGGNVFDVALSVDANENVAPEGLRMFSLSPTVRIPNRQVLTEVRFRIPDNATALFIGNFDAAGADVTLETKFQSFPLKASAQDEWQTTQVAIDAALRGAEAAIVMRGGTEMPNDLTLFITDASGRLIPFELSPRAFAVNNRPVAVGSVEDISSCMTMRFDGRRSSDPENNRLLHRWVFGDGATAVGDVVTHEYRIEGRFQARLEVSDQSPQLGNSSLATLDVFVKRPPDARSNVRRLVGLGENVLFDGAGSSARAWSIARHRWKISDGTVLDGTTAVHAFQTSGTYRVVHSIEDNSGHRCNSATEEFEIRVNAPPVAVAGENQMVTASVVQFDGSKSSDADDPVLQYEWDFGDGSTGSGPRPVHVYAQPGTYTVELTVSDGTGTARSTATDTVQIVINARPVADAEPALVGAPGQRLTFDGSRSVDPDGGIVAYEWDFRDGTAGSGARLTHAFARPGTYMVRLKVRDNSGHDEAIDFSETKVVINASPVAIAGPGVRAAPGDEVRLSGGRSFDPDGKVVSHRWDFSDGGSPVLSADAVRRFDKPGIYTARLTVTDDSGALNASASDEVRIAINNAPVANAGDDVATDKTIVAFDGSKSVDADGDALTYRWDFGDGQTASGQRVVHSYARPGLYPVVLVVDDGSGLRNATSRHAIAVRINSAPVAVAGENKRVCTGDNVVFDGSKSSDPDGGVLRYTWDFGDGSKSEIVNPSKVYQKGGVYPVTLTVRDNSGLANNTDTARISIRVDQGPSANAGKPIIACVNTEVRLDGSASTDVDGVVNSFHWDFGDGSFGSGERPVHVYKRPGKYRAFLTIQGEKVGICSDTATDEVAVEIVEGPVAVIAAPPAVPFAETVKFDGSGSRLTTDKITRWHWDFGDGTTASGQRAEHRYAKPGTYTVALTLTSDSPSSVCKTVSAQHVVIVNAPPQAAIKANRLAAVNEEVVLDASASHDPDGGIVAYEWNLGDGTTAQGMVVRHQYRTPGTYNVRLIVRDDAGLPNSIAAAQTDITINAPPLPVIAGPGAICVGERGSWRAEQPGDAGRRGARLLWSFGDGTEVAAAEASHEYRRPGRYSLAVYAEGTAGAASRHHHATRIVSVSRPPYAGAASSSRTVCPGEIVNFDGSSSVSPDAKIARYVWDFGDGRTAEGVKVQHAFARPGAYQVKLSVTDDTGSSCGTTTTTLNIVVNASPLARIRTEPEAWTGGANDAVLLDGSGSSHPAGLALSFRWQIGEASEVGERVRHAFSASGDVPVRLTVSDSSGLSCGTATDVFRVRVRQRD